MINLVTVYGTLKQGFGADGYMRGRTNLLGTATLPGSLYSLGGFPGVTLNTDHTFDAEVYEIIPETRDQLLRDLDRYEGEGSLYHRRTIETPFGESYIYEYNGDPREPVMQRWGT